MKSKKSSKEVASKIISTIKNSEFPLTRKEIAERTGLRLSSVCGRVKELLVDNVIEGTGKKYDKDSDRIVETITIKEATTLPIHFFPGIELC